MNSLIALKWYNLILDCNSMTESMSLSLHRILKSKLLYFNISQGRNHSSFPHWNREHVTVNLDCRKTETATYRAIFINSADAAAFFNTASKCQPDSLEPAEPLWHRRCKRSLSPEIHSWQKVKLQPSHFIWSIVGVQLLPNPQHSFHLFLLINHNYD